MAGKLTARKVETAKAGRFSDGDGLYLVVTPAGSRKWVFRWMRQGRSRDMGLGRAGDVSLAEARQRCADARRALRDGIDPIEQRKKGSKVPDFGHLADEVRQSLEKGFSNAKHRQQWRNTLATYAAPLWSRPVDAITTDEVLAILEPIWVAKPETASRVRGRIERILDAAKARGFRAADNPARWRGHLDHLLPKRTRLTRGHHAAMPYRNIPGFMRSLRQREGFAALAVELVVLTAGRSGEVRGMRWAEIDLENALWTVPANRMKAGREHCVPLAPRAIQILKHLAELKRGDLVFPGLNPSRPLSSTALDRVLDRLGIKNATVHGFRSAFRDWAGNETEFSRELIEEALAHVIPNMVERAYRRQAAIAKRRTLMQAWSNFVEGSRNVVQLRQAGS